LSDDKRARARRAGKLREEVERLRAREPRPPKTPHEFVEKRAREAGAESGSGKKKAGGEGK
jgi:hypothetical protein